MQRDDERDDAACPGAYREAGAVVIACPAMRTLYSALGRVAVTSAPVLFLGETGTGKEVLSYALHRLSGRAAGPYKVINCGAIPASLMESVLFGHERGAFSGADRLRQGPFEHARGGTLLLDEVGDLSAAAQVALLRVLETKRLIRVGGTDEIELDVRIAAATNRDLRELVRAGTFRMDLLYRLNTFTIQVPPLRARVEEIEPLAQLFLERACEQWAMLGRRFDASASDWLRAQAWPGNIRQLKSTVERALIDSTHVIIGELDLRTALDSAEGPSGVEAPLAEACEPTLVSTDNLTERVRRYEASLIRAALSAAKGSQTHAARMLGIPRRTLAHKAHAHGLVK